MILINMDRFYETPIMREMYVGDIRYPGVRRRKNRHPIASTQGISMDDLRCPSDLGRIRMERKVEEKGN
jgi:hypothetical protein